MKKVAFILDRYKYDIYKLILDRILKDNNKNIDLERINFEPENIDEYFLKYEYLLFDHNIQDNNNFFYFNNKFNGIDLKEKSFRKLIKHFELDLNNKQVLIIENSKFFKSIYSALNEFDDIKVKIVTYDTNKSYNLKKGDYYVNNLEVSRLNSIYCVINTSQIGNDYELNPLNLDINYELAIETLINPVDTSFLKKSRLNNSKTINGIYLAIFEIISFLEIYDESIKINSTHVNELYIYIMNILEPSIDEYIDKVDTSGDFIKLLKGVKYDE